ncbi:MAG TPA: hypothetical protein VKT49_10215, partial [Bryobacteraceae bacterium]|nr:hypothetical protein [Bryobacteraceae bacterium]
MLDTRILRCLGSVLCQQFGFPRPYLYDFGDSVRRRLPPGGLLCAHLTATGAIKALYSTQTPLEG